MSNKDVYCFTLNDYGRVKNENAPTGHRGIIRVSRGHEKNRLDRMSVIVTPRVKESNTFTGFYV